jgi:hypothetical protein
MARGHWQKPTPRCDSSRWLMNLAFAKISRHFAAPVSAASSAFRADNRRAKWS